MDSKQRSKLIVAVVVIAAVAVIGVGLAIALGRGSDPAGAAASLEPASDPGDDPFTESVAAAPVADFPANVADISASTRKTLKTDPTSQALVATGTAPGLYGGTGEKRVCDPDKLAAFLKANPAKAKAWASVEGITVAGIPRFVGRLTPVVLTSDTLVGNHGYKDGKATSLTSVLQAGTAVMVDATGTPRVKCNCGNPLTQPEPLTAPATGKAWTGYQPGQVVTVSPGKPTATFTIVDVNTGDPVHVPVPTPTGATTDQWVAAEIAAPLGSPDPTSASTIVTSKDGKTWATVAKIPGETVLGLAHGDGRWLAVANKKDAKGSQVYSSTDLKAWKQIAATPDQLSGIAYGKGRWVATGTEYIDPLVTGGTPHFAAASATSTDGTHWTKTDLAGATNANLTVPVAFGQGRWLTAIGGFEPRNGDVSDYRLDLYASTDGSAWSPTGTTLDAATDASLAFGGGGWGLGELPSYPMVDGPAKGTPLVLATSQDAKAWTMAVDEQGLPNGDYGVSAIASNGKGWLAVYDAGTQDDPASTALVSPDGTSWHPAGTVPTTISAVAWGPAPSSGAGTTPSTTTSSTTPTTSRGGSGGDCGPLSASTFALHVLTPSTETQSSVDPNWGVLRPNDLHESANIDVLHCVSGTWIFVYFDDPSGQCVLVTDAEKAPNAVRQDLDLHC